jgi:hypothetical protein
LTLASQVEGLSDELQRSVMRGMVKAEPCLLVIAPNLRKGAEGEILLENFQIQHRGLPSTNKIGCVVALLRGLADSLEQRYV